MQNTLVRILPKGCSKLYINNVSEFYYLNLKIIAFVRLCWGRIMLCTTHLSGSRDLIIATLWLWREKSSDLLVQSRAALTSRVIAAIQHVLSKSICFYSTQVFCLHQWVFYSCDLGCMRNQPFFLVLITMKIRWHVRNDFPCYCLPGVLAGCLSYCSETFLVALIQQWQPFC